ncbi:MAG: hypothetical protein ABJB61_13565 [bacterium]
MSEEIKPDRRGFLRTATMTVAAVELSMFGSAHEQASKIKPAEVPTVKPGTNTSFGPLKQINAGLLNVGYVRSLEMPSLTHPLSRHVGILTSVTTVN